MMLSFAILVFGNSATPSALSLGAWIRPARYKPSVVCAHLRGDLVPYPVSLRLELAGHVIDLTFAGGFPPRLTVSPFVRISYTRPFLLHLARRVHCEAQIICASFVRVDARAGATTCL